MLCQATKIGVCQKVEKSVPFFSEKKDEDTFREFIKENMTLVKVCKRSTFTRWRYSGDQKYYLLCETDYPGPSEWSARNDIRGNKCAKIYGFKSCL